jgi:ABC-type glycerol-3-phosphate transport system substrate-binding protein
MMKMRARRVRVGFAVLAAAAGLAACSSSFGGGSSPPAQGTVILQPGQTAVCANGTAPPCH